MKHSNYCYALKEQSKMKYKNLNIGFFYALTNVFRNIQIVEAHTIIYISLYNACSVK